MEAGSLLLIFQKVELTGNFGKTENIRRKSWYRSARRADCQESDLQILYRLSGTEETFQIAKEKIRGRVLLHFGAVDHLCRVWINEKEAGIHQGGYSSFCMDITELVTEGENVLIVYAEDDSRNGNYGRGKQSRHYKSHGCFYTRTTGIWQSVWLEFVPEAYISGLKIETDAFQKRVFATLELMDGEGAELQCQIFDGEKVIQEQSVRTEGKAVTWRSFCRTHSFGHQKIRIFTI